MGEKKVGKRALTRYTCCILDRLEQITYQKKQLKNGWHSRRNHHRPCHQPISGHTSYGPGSHCTIETPNGPSGESFRPGQARVHRKGRSVSVQSTARKGVSNAHVYRYALVSGPRASVSGQSLAGGSLSLPYSHAALRAAGAIRRQPQRAAAAAFPRAGLVSRSSGGPPRVAPASVPGNAGQSAHAALGSATFPTAQRCAARDGGATGRTPVCTPGF